MDTSEYMPMFLAEAQEHLQELNLAIREMYAGHSSQTCEFANRKFWEWCAISQALDERKKLRTGLKGLGFAVGTEPLSSHFAARGCRILATDLAPELSAEALGGVRCPVLLVEKKKDESTRRAQGRRFAEINALARYVELDGAAHAVHHQCPDRFEQVISAFLTEVDNERAGSHAATKDS